MALSNMELIQTTDGDVNQLQINVKRTFTPLINNPLLGGNILQATLVVGDNQISHGLNRTLQGWIIVDRNGASSIYRNQGTQNPSQILVLNSSAAVTVSLYVF
jgi:hypothetical protein